MRARPWLRGLLSFVPGFDALAGTRGCAQGTLSPRYCYSIWLRHLSLAHHGGLDTRPRTIAELGPGASIGVGIAALLTGCERYWALDVVSYANGERNLQVFESLIELLRRREEIPHDPALADVQPALESYAFPHHILTDDRLQQSLAPARLERLREAIRCMGTTEGSQDETVSYMVPWHGSRSIRPGSVDAILSQAVLEHVNDVRSTYSAMHAWLRIGGWMSHQIDFRSHSTTDAWNGHWGISDLQWAIARGRRSYFLNREPCSRHLAVATELGFRVVHAARQRDPTGIGRSALAQRFRDLPDDDQQTCGLFLQAVKAA